LRSTKVRRTFEANDVDSQEWIDVNAARVRMSLANPTIRAEVFGLLTGEDPEAKRQRRREQIEREMVDMELRWSPRRDDPAARA
jgi:hypothetical protein